ncbi:hypothetical protein GA0070607_5926 [Micromonospora coriariae]|uniref:Uncharacterized protein n=1 Tax=Micromonospora coriariae TaxID=285665 RepID=A0A1C4XYS2_9ACTN|nr:hypothetical protein GA0070607_5926 [Micromonospora coriariae]
MDQSPLPRGSSQVRDRPGQPHGTVTELAKTTVAVEAEYPAHPSGAMIVVQMLRVRAAADRADPALLGQELVKLLLPHAVAPPQVVFTTAAVQPELALLALLVVARLAVSAVTPTARAVTRKVAESLDDTAFRASPVPLRHYRQRAHIPALLLLHALGIAGLRTDVEAGFAVAATTFGAPAAGTELVERQPLATVSTAAAAVPIIRGARHVRIVRLCPTHPLFVHSLSRTPRRSPRERSRSRRAGRRRPR